MLAALLALALGATPVTLIDRANPVRRVHASNSPDGGIALDVYCVNCSAGGGVSSTVSVDNYPASQTVNGPATNAQLRETPLSVGGTFWQATQPVSGTFFQATQPVSATALPLPTDAATQTTLALIKAKTDNLDVALSTRTKPADSQHVIVDSSASVAVTGPATDAQLRATPVPVSGTVTANVGTGTQPVSGTLIVTQGLAADGGVDWTVRVGNLATTSTNVLYVYPVAPPLQPVSSPLQCCPPHWLSTLRCPMKTLLLLLAFAVPALAQPAQPATPVQQSPTMLNAAQLVSCASGTAQQTVTVTPPSGQYVYVLNVDIVSAAVTAPAASALTHTSTNLGGMKWYGGLTATAGVADKSNWIASQPLKSAVAGTAVTVVSNAAITNVTYNVCVTYYTAY